MLAEVREALKELIAVHQTDPLDLLTECDLQAFLFMKLREKIGEKTAASQPGALPIETFSTGEVQTSLVHTEYGAQRFDVALIDPALVESTADYQVRLAVKSNNEAIWDLRMRAAIELKQLRIGYRLRGALLGLATDIAKLRDYRSHKGKFAGVAVLFVQSCAPAIAEQIRCQQIFRPVNEHAEIEVIDGVVGYIITPCQTFRVD